MRCPSCFASLLGSARPERCPRCRWRLPEPESSALARSAPLASPAAAGDGSPALPLSEPGEGPSKRKHPFRCPGEGSCFHCDLSAHKHRLRAIESAAGRARRKLPRGIQ